MFGLYDVVVLVFYFGDCFFCVDYCLFYFLFLCFGGFVVVFLCCFVLFVVGCCGVVEFVGGEFFWW